MIQIVSSTDLFRRARRRHQQRQRRLRDSEGHRIRYIEEIWTLVRKWAERNGHEYDASYGVKGVAAA